MEALEAVSYGIADLAGLPVEQIRYALCIAYACPLSTLIFRAIPAKFGLLRNVLSMASAILLTMYCHGATAWVPSFICSTCVYLILMVVPHPYAHQLTFVFSMGYLSYLHFFRWWSTGTEWSLDTTGPQMILTIKLTTFAINYYDGTRKDKSNQTEFQKKHRIEKLPSLLDFYGFVYFLPSFLAGPYVEYVDYRDFMNGSMFKGLPGNKPPNSFLGTLVPFGHAFMALPFLIVGMKFFPVDYLLTAQFASAPFWEKFLRMPFHTSPLRIRYYFGWSLAEASFVATGIAYNGVDKNGNIKWDKYRNSNVLGIEFPENTRSVTENWNVATSVWLKHYVYGRFPTDARGAPLSVLPTVATYATSAFWHGFYPGYYLFFFSLAMYTETGKLARRKLRPYFVDAEGKPRSPMKYVYDIAGMITTISLFDYAGPAFGLLEIAPTMAVWSTLYYYGHVFIIVSYIVLTIMPTPRRPQSRNSTAASSSAATTPKTPVKSVKTN